MEKADQTKAMWKYKETSENSRYGPLPRFCISPDAYRLMTKPKRLFKVIQWLSWMKPRVCGSRSCRLFDLQAAVGVKPDS